MSTQLEIPNDKLLCLREEGEQSLLVQMESFVARMADVVAKSEALIPAANEFTVETETDFSFADELRVSLEAEAKADDVSRMPLTRLCDDLKSWIMDQVKPAIANKRGAAAIYNRKALAFLAAKRAEEQARVREAERIQRETQARLEAEAQKREAAAAKLKTEAGRQKAQQEADALRLAAQTTPPAMAMAAPPQSTASNVGEKWHWEQQDWAAFCGWLARHPEWLNERGTNNCVIGPRAAAMNKLANHYADTLVIPGLRIWSEDHLRKKPQR